MGCRRIPNQATTGSRGKLGPEPPGGKGSRPALSGAACFMGDELLGLQGELAWWGQLLPPMPGRLHPGRLVEGLPVLHHFEVRGIVPPPHGEVAAADLDQHNSASFFAPRREVYFPDHDGPAR